MEVDIPWPEKNRQRNISIGGSVMFYVATAVGQVRVVSGGLRSIKTRIPP